ncbi:hypothetical protein [Laribacter hongkongensis]|uniref:hypothetical protein n=1 Tax=Laribacter hongkongensis TaxID=168471 RepID=UPI001EFE083A|nr:hypothetical protein [Laribacter hongkongensis]MCG9083960.1 hypothetical protein [Laribacter hongkongensis]
MSNHPADLARALADLATGPPCSKAAVMRVMLPHIESALASDRATQSSIRQTLAAAGFTYSESEFRNALHRARKGRHAPGKTTAPPPPAAQPKPAPLPPTPAPASTGAFSSPPPGGPRTFAFKPK